MRISDVLRDKGDRVVTIDPGAQVQQLLALLAEHGIGAAVVSGDGAAVQGIVSERDIVRALARRGAAVLTEPVSAIATTDVRTVGPDADLAEVERLMTEGRFRHLPVLVDGRLGGIASIGDVVKRRMGELENERTALAGYITGEPG
ncbi:CBS domain-containing protein [Spirilliplanes yamanashiensis]|uniref:Histidine kinase n=1 Tax=Spirilliplanes yamanashiensis TaxID=42233 RepID=A0A8J3YA81_9ACTN|nr:CBS domain-containing protein [Spirilliplanes yamanashiensis]MDP9818086.1 CBS domain-containing protein [Spirilliplanes yamanashiensis]GIJ04896.1 histidine kinase [Spirilliplanes yamanashiensis]